MTIAPRPNGTFVEPIDELLSRFGLPTHQISAIIKPLQPIRHLARTTAQKQALERDVNELLSDPSVS